MRASTRFISRTFASRDVDAAVRFERARTRAPLFSISSLRVAGVGGARVRECGVRGERRLRRAVKRRHFSYTFVKMWR